MSSYLRLQFSSNYSSFLNFKDSYFRFEIFTDENFEFSNKCDFPKDAEMNYLKIQPFSKIVKKFLKK